jgi:hypothetical protein
LLTDQDIAKWRKRLERGIISQEEFGIKTGLGIKEHLDNLVMKYDDPRRENVPDVLSGSLHQQYQGLFATSMIPGDEIWSYSFGVSFAGGGGLALVRDGEVIDWHDTWKS